MESADRLRVLLSSFRNKQCLLFAGAGFSVGAKRTLPDGTKAPLLTGQGLSDLLKDLLKDDSDDLSSLAGTYEDENGEHGLYNLLTSLFVASDHSAQQAQITQFAWKDIYTTNYDNVIELTFSSRGQQYSVYSQRNKPSEIDYRTTPIVHINGLVAGTTFSDFKKEVKLTDTKYMADDFSRSVWGERFRSDVITSPCIVFAGYSLADLDVARILNTFDGIKERIFFVVHETPSRAQQRRLQDYGTIVPIGTDGLAAIIEQIAKDDAPSPPPSMVSWRKVELPRASVRGARDIDVVNFLMSGSVDDGLFSRDVIENREVLSIRRTVTEQMADLIEDGTLNNLIVTSNIGNGKSIAVESLAVRLSSRNIPVYVAATAKVNLLLKELPLLKQTSGKFVIIVEDAFSNIDVIRAIVNFGRSDVYIVSTARTSQFELFTGQIAAAFGGQFENFDLNFLDESEVKSLVLLLDRYALWGDRQSLSMDRKERFIRHDCSGELRFVLLELLDSPVIKTRIQSIFGFDDIVDVDAERLRTILVISQLLNLAEIAPDISLISELLQFDARKVMAGQANKLRDFSLVKNGRISIRSSIFAEYVLKKLIDTPSVIEALLTCMRNLDIIHDNDRRYSDVFQNFSRFRFVEMAVAVEKRRQYMLGYFEQLKELNHCREHTLFWLQYAMCRLSLEQFREAERLFDAAFSYSKKYGYVENRHLNNQFARFLLESRTKSNEYTDFMVAFNRAHGICVKQIQSDPASYNPYRVATNYLPFLERRLSQLDTGDIVGLLRSCGEIVRLAENKKREFANNRVVDDCVSALNKAIGICKRRLGELGVAV